MFVVSRIEGRRGEENGVLAGWQRRVGKVPSSWGGEERRGKCLRNGKEQLQRGQGVELGRKLHPWTLGCSVGGGVNEGKRAWLWAGLTQAVSQERGSFLLHSS